MKKRTAADLFFGPPSDEAELRHLSDFLAPDPFVAIRCRGKTHLLVNGMEEQRAKRTAKNATVWSPHSLELPEGASGSAVEMILAASGKLGVKDWSVTRSFPLFLAEELRRHHHRVEVRTDDPRKNRSVKTAREIGLIRRAQRAAAAAIRRARSILQESEIREDGELFWDGTRLTSERLRAEIETFLLSRQLVCESPIVAGGRQAADPHERGSGPLRAGEFIVLDIFPRDRNSGYWGDITRTVIKGAATAEQLRRFRAVCRAQREALSRIRAGVSCASVHDAVLRSLERDGYPRQRVGGRAEGMIHGTGHGVGLEIHEHPRLGAGRETLRAGQTVTVEPGLYSRADGGIRMEDLVVVTGTGCRKLADAPRDPAIP